MAIGAITSSSVAFLKSLKREVLPSQLSDCFGESRLLHITETLLQIKQRKTTLPSVFLRCFLLSTYFLFVQSCTTAL